MTQAEYEVRENKIKETYRKAYNVSNIEELADLAIDSMPLNLMSLEDMLAEFENCLEAQIADAGYR